MKYLLLAILLISGVAQADQIGFGVNLNQGQPSYGADYDFLATERVLAPYLDLSLLANSQIIQPGLGLGLQILNVNLGIALQNQIKNLGNSAYSAGPLGFGPELGFKETFGSGPFFFKENNSYIDFGGTFYFSATLGLGFTL